MSDVKSEGPRGRAGVRWLSKGVHVDRYSRLAPARKANVSSYRQKLHWLEQQLNSAQDPVSRLWQEWWTSDEQRRTWDLSISTYLVGGNTTKLELSRYPSTYWVTADRPLDQVATADPALVAELARADLLASFNAAAERWHFSTPPTALPLSRRESQQAASTTGLKVRAAAEVTVVAETILPGQFTDPIYNDPTAEYGPFGSDLAADVFLSWEESSEALGADSTVRDVLARTEEDVEGLFQEVERMAPELDAVIVGGAFTLLRLTGHIDAEGLILVRRVLTRWRDVLKRPEATVMLNDLERWSATR